MNPVSDTLAAHAEHLQALDRHLAAQVRINTALFQTIDLLLTRIEKLEQKEKDA